MGGSPEPTAGRGAALSPSPRSTAQDAGTGSALDSAVRAYLAHLAVERGLAANTIHSYRRDLRRYAEVQAARGRAAIGDIAEDDVRAFLVGLREGDAGHPPLSAGSAARALVAVRGLHRFALREGLAAGDPAHDVKPPTPPRRTSTTTPAPPADALPPPPRPHLPASLSPDPVAVSHLHHSRPL
ncbi:site-specific integrase, partial [Actinomadura sp. BRA 177]|nr:site-specific integrase [Actinomadura sp. BRA 177]